VPRFVDQFFSPIFDAQHFNVKHGKMLLWCLLESCALNCRHQLIVAFSLIWVEAECATFDPFRLQII